MQEGPSSLAEVVKPWLLLAEKPETRTEKGGGLVRDKGGLTTAEPPTT